MRATVLLSELLDAFDWVSAAVPFQNKAFVSRQTGQIFWDPAAAGLDEELPEDVEDGTLHVCVPHKHDLDIGQRLVFDFVEENVPAAYGEVRNYFSRRGGYARFKYLLERRGLLEDWYSYEQQAREAALRAWAESRHLEVVEGQRAET